MTARRPANARDGKLAAAMVEEERYIAQRGAAAPNRRVGLALSGGGIRSATFSLGILQALSRYGLIKRLDYLSTVSGGSYIGSFFGALYVPPELRGGAKDDEAAFVEHPLQSPRGRTAVANLREFGRYLTPGGASDTMYGISTIGRNWVALQVVLGLLPLFFFLTVRLLSSLLNDATQRSLSGVLIVGAVVAVLLSGAAGIAYWHSRRESVPKSLFVRIITNAPIIATTVAAVLMLRATPPVSATALLYSINFNGCPVAVQCWTLPQFGTAAIATVLGGSTIFYIATVLTQRAFRTAAEAPGEEEENVRSRLTRLLAIMLLLTIALAVAIWVDFLGGKLVEATSAFGEHSQLLSRKFQGGQTYGALRLGWRFFWPFVAVAAPALLTFWAHGALRRGSGPGWLSRPTGQGALGLSILFLWGVIWAAIARALGGTPLIAAWALAAAALAVISLCYGFLNQSSLVSLYATRLKRAYIGASNPGDATMGYDISRGGDTVPMDVYYGDPATPTLSLRRPVHLINVTIAQTQPDGASNVVAYDRKGKPMHVSPAGLVYQYGGAGLSATMPRHGGEELTLSTWTAISGAAASTAIGSMTSLGLSILAMMANVRLGYWWKATTRKWYQPKSASDTVLGYLSAELQSNFTTDDDHQRWYLTDGGHFENTGAYALIQRRLDFVMVCDNGADPDYRLDDVVRLIDRARSDLGADIRFLSAGELDDRFGKTSALRRYFGSYDELATKPPASEAERRGKPMPYAALAVITYDIEDRGLPGAKQDDEPREGLLMLIKPRLNFSEPPDLLAYQRREAGAAFPQQTTLDQFFDEEQWEAYRRFGEVVGERLFAVEPNGWSPNAALSGAPPVEPPLRQEPAKGGAHG